MEKGCIEQIGSINERGVITGFVITGGDYSGIDYSCNPPRMCGYTPDELGEICKTKALLSSLTELDEETQIVIPAGRYKLGVFTD